MALALVSVCSNNLCEHTVIGLRSCALTYINAFIVLDRTERAYPVNCLRVDVRVGDRVIITNPDGQARAGRVDRLEYHNWNCRWTIRCLASEADYDNGRVSIDRSVPMKVGLVEFYDVPRHLAATGWTRRDLVSRQFKVGYTLANAGHTCHILVRTNGFDVALSDGVITLAELEKPLSFSDGDRHVRHSLNESGINLIAHMVAFADAFRVNAADIETFMVRVGSSSKKKPDVEKGDTTMHDIYDAISGGSGGAAYLGDGVYLTPGGWYND